MSDEARESTTAEWISHLAKAQEKKIEFLRDELADKDKRIEELETLHRELVEELNSDPEAHLMGWEGDDE